MTWQSHLKALRMMFCKLSPLLIVAVTIFFEYAAFSYFKPINWDYMGVRMTRDLAVGEETKTQDLMQVQLNAPLGFPIYGTNIKSVETACMRRALRPLKKGELVFYKDLSTRNTLLSSPSPESAADGCIEFNPYDPANTGITQLNERHPK